MTSCASQARFFEYKSLRRFLNKAHREVRRVIYRLQSHCGFQSEQRFIYGARSDDFHIDFVFTEAWALKWMLE